MAAPFSFLYWRLMRKNDYGPKETQEVSTFTDLADFFDHEKIWNLDAIFSSENNFPSGKMRRNCGRIVSSENDK